MPSEPGVDVAAVDRLVCKLASQALTVRAWSRKSRESAVRTRLPSGYLSRPCNAAYMAYSESAGARMMG